MSFQAKCSKCGFEFEADNEWENQNAECPECKEVFIITKPNIVMTENNNETTHKKNTKLFSIIGLIIIIILSLGMLFMYYSKDNKEPQVERKSVTKKIEPKKKSDKKLNVDIRILLDINTKASNYYDKGDYEKAKEQYDTLFKIIDGKTINDDALKIIVEQAKKNNNKLIQYLAKTGNQITGKCYIQLNNNNKIIRTPSIALLKRNNETNKIYAEYLLLAKECEKNQKIVDNTKAYRLAGRLPEVTDASIALYDAKNKFKNIVSRLIDKGAIKGFTKPTRPDSQTGTYVIDSVPTGDFYILALDLYRDQIIHWIVPIEKQEGKQCKVDLTNSNFVVIKK